MWKGLLHHYKEYLPVNENTPMLSLSEGNTPLIPLENLSNQLGIELYVKTEGTNPTGSFKDRGMVMAVAKAIEEGSDTIICASTGNTSAAASAYAARAGIRSIVVIPDGKIAMGKLAQAVMYGAEIFAIKGNFDHALKIVRNLSENSPINLVNSVNPYRIEGQKTAAFEVCEQLGGQAPDILAIPVGNAGNITAYWKGFKEFHEKHQTGLPQMRGFEAEGAAAIVRNQVIEDPETVATAIRIGNPASWEKAVDAANSSNGKIDEVTDKEIIEAYQTLAQTEGVFAEPASCASIAGIFKQIKSGEIKKGSKIVAVLTGNGLKDPNTAIDYTEIQPTVLPNDEQVLFDHILGAKTEMIGDMFKITVPGSTANLGPGFDSIGLAVNRYLQLEVKQSDRWMFVPENDVVASIPSGKDNLVYQVAEKFAARYDEALPPCHVRVTSDIPFARGLGSSAAAIVAGIELAKTLCGLLVTKEEMLRFASEYEGHPDNVGASLYGGLVIGCHQKEETNLVHVNDINVDAVVIIPDYEVKTKDARGILPKQLSHSHAVEASAVSNLLVAALISKNWELAGRMMQRDLLHQPYRTTLIPDMNQMIGVAKEAGAYGVALSGAGPTVFCLVKKGNANIVSAEIKKHFPNFSTEKILIETEGSKVENLTTEERKKIFS